MNEEDDLFARVFAPCGGELPEEPFVGDVMRRIRWRVRLRAIVLGSAALLGIAFAFEPLVDLTALSAGALASVARNWNDVQWLSEHAASITALVALLGWPAVVRWLAR
jgi:hypothetical protein